MDLINHDYPQKFINKHNDTPCISLYQPTHRTFPEREQDVIRFKNLTKEIEKSLHQKFPAHVVQSLLAPFHHLMEDYNFWNHTHNGLAVLSTPEFFNVYKLPRAVPEVAIVADSFHIKPLIRLMQSADQYQILGLNRSHIKLFEGNRDQVERIELAKEVPETLEAALGSELTEPRLTVSTNYGKGDTGPAPMYHGHGGRKDDVELDDTRFFHLVDEAILKHHSKKSHLPLILAALPEHQGIFRKLSHSPYLLKEGILLNPDSLSLEELREKAWALIEPYYLARLEKFIHVFAEAASKHHGSDKLDDIALAAVEGRIETLLIDADQRIAGQINHATGKVKCDERLDPTVDDILDDLGELVIKTGGEVIVVPGERMPTENGAAAIYRF